MARGLAVAVLLIVVVAAVAPFACAGPETLLTGPAVAAATQAAGAIQPGLPLYQETANPKKDVAGAAGVGGIQPGLPLYQETGNPKKDAASAVGAGGIQPGLPLYQDIGSGQKA